MKQIAGPDQVFNGGFSIKARKFLFDVVNLGLEFKAQKRFRTGHSSPAELAQSIVKDLNEEGIPVDVLLKKFKETVLPDCSNFGSPYFMGFPDAGNSVAGVGGAIMSDFLQQNLINQSFCAPSATFVEIAVIRWLREAVGYNSEEVNGIWNVGGIVTPGGTSSNTIAMMLARENKIPDTIEKGVSDPSKFKIVVPKGIGHYSVKSAQRWIGCGNNLIEVETDHYRYDLNALKEALIEHKGSIMAVVAYAGDSRTMTVDRLDQVADLVKEIDPSVWLHADACHGFSLGFSASLRHKIKGIERFDSISTDPHKVMLIPYTLSALLVKDPANFKKIVSLSDLIMQEEYAFGQITPFIGSKPWISLKLWFMMQNFGKNGIDRLITERHESARTFAALVSENPKFTLINKVDINAVAFVYTGEGITDIEEINMLSKHIHQRILTEGKFHLHQFSIPDPGFFKKGAILYPLRFMGGNPNITKQHMNDALADIERMAEEKLSQKAYAI